MFDLKCKRMNCKFNEDCNCTAKNVDVDKATDCTTYQDVGYKKEKDEIKQPPYRKNTSVSCKARCIFNDHTVCKANGISVMTDDFKPKCCTFLPK